MFHLLTVFLDTRSLALRVATLHIHSNEKKQDFVWLDILFFIKLSKGATEKHVTKMLYVSTTRAKEKTRSAMDGAVEILYDDTIQNSLN